MQRFWLLPILLLALMRPLAAQEIPLGDPGVGARSLIRLSPTVLELEVVSDRPLTASGSLDVHAGTTVLHPSATGFRRRVLYAAQGRRDLRIGNSVYLELPHPVEGRLSVTWQGREVSSSVPTVSPVIHVNQVGYGTDDAKHAFIGYYLGTLGELEVPSDTMFTVVDTTSGIIAFSGRLTPRPDTGWGDGRPSPYTHVLQADFSALQTPGEYRIHVDGIGDSYPFVISDGTLAAVVRTYALGLYHQRCGTALKLPFTRFVHEACHTAPAAVPTMASKWAEVNAVLARWSHDGKSPGPPLSNIAGALFPFVNPGPVDVSDGHHDAGDYSKYVVDSAQLIHSLVFAVDAFPGVAALDNLGLPESGDGKSDLLQEALWESRYLSKMQDQDGGFYFLVYPQQEQYEDKMPDRGDPQCVFPKTTTSTAAAVAALADMAGSPHFKAAYPGEAARYLAQARKGWDFLQHALKQYGHDGSYQTLNTYGVDFGADDELAWAAAALYTATGEPQYQTWLLSHCDPARAVVWGWIHMPESYGCAFRDYAFAARIGKLKPDQLNRDFLSACEAQIRAAAEDELSWTRGSAYGLALPFPSKRSMNPGWFFANAGPFDMTVAYQLHPQDALRTAVLDNMDYELGDNPVNVCYLAGLGWRRPHLMVSQFAESDGLALPPTGIPMGCLQTGYGWLAPYGKELREASFPSDDGNSATPYPLYDRYADTWNVTTECTSATQARCLASLAFWMARTPLARQPWRPIPAAILGLPAPELPLGETVTLRMSGAPSGRHTRIVWEAEGHTPVIGDTFRYKATEAGPAWVEAEAQAEDGRRAFAIRRFSVRGATGTP